MSNNDQIVLEKTIEQLVDDESFGGSLSDFFELFCAEQILKDYDLSTPEIESGIIGGGGDGGIDGFYLFVNQELAQDDFDISSVKKGAKIELVLIQAKLEGGFKETPVERFITFSECIFNLGKEVSDFEEIFNRDVLNAIVLFRKIYESSLTKKIKLEVTFCYCTKGVRIEGNVLGKKDILINSASKHFSDASFEFKFFGSPELLAEYRREPEKTFSLKLAENPVSVANQVGCFVALVNLSDYFSFIINDRGNLRRDIFEANVRDYQGGNEVNKQIKETLADGHGEDFWWLNNGITIVASAATQSSKALSIDDPQIVNGLQTSKEIFECYQNLSDEEKEGAVDQRSVLVRVIVPINESSRDNIIRATNSQTAIQIASLRSTDKIHRDIEDYFKPHGLFYDRRKNFHKNNGADKTRIIPVGLLAQAVTSVLLLKPHVARARPSSLLKSDEQYAKIFNENMAVVMYRVCAEAALFVSAQMKRVSSQLSRTERNNLKFFLILDLMMNVSRSSSLDVKEICSVDTSSFDEIIFEVSLERVRTAFTNVGQTDAKAKSDILTREVIRLFEEAQVAEML